jgi:hypothetical protein
MRVPHSISLEASAVGKPCDDGSQMVIPVGYVRLVPASCNPDPAKRVPVAPLVRGTACCAGVRFVMPCSQFIELELSSKEYAKRRHVVAQPLSAAQFWTAYLIQFHRIEARLSSPFVAAKMHFPSVARDPPASNRLYGLR